MLDQSRLTQFLVDLRHVDERGGPAPAEFDRVLAMFEAIRDVRLEPQDNELICEFREQQRSFATLDTMQGFACRRPYGYPGDFEIIDRIYTGYETRHPELVAWDRFFHATDAAVAVRSRKAYCIELFRSVADHHPVGARILNVACGPCRDVLEFKRLQSAPVRNARVTCLDADPRAIDYAQQLLSWDPSVAFRRANVMTATLPGEFDLIWCAGLCDYLSDRALVVLLKRLFRALAIGGELVVGNLQPSLSARPYMEFGDWILTYRTADDLICLGLRAGFFERALSVDQEATGKNLFLRVRKERPSHEDPAASPSHRPDERS